MAEPSATLRSANFFRPAGAITAKLHKYCILTNFAKQGQGNEGHNAATKATSNCTKRNK